MDGVSKKLKRIEKSLDAIERGRYSELSLDYCCDYIGWVAKYKKVPDNVWNPICDRIIELYKNGFGIM